MQYFFAQFGKNRERNRSLEMLLSRDELPWTGWEDKGTKSWRTGTGDVTSKSLKRAHEMGSFSAARSFGHADSSGWLVIEVRPYATSDEADTEVPNLQARLLPIPKSQNSVTEERVIEDQVIAGVNRTYMFEQMVEGELGSGMMMYVVGSVDQILFTVIRSGRSGTWEWGDMTTIATLESRKIRKVQEEP